MSFLIKSLRNVEPVSELSMETLAVWESTFLSFFFSSCVSIAAVRRNLFPILCWPLKYMQYNFLRGYQVWDSYEKDIQEFGLTFLILKYVGTRKSDNAQCSNVRNK